MKITYTDGSTLHVTSITIGGNILYCDDCYFVPIEEVESISDDQQT